MLYYIDANDGINDPRINLAFEEYVLKHLNTRVKISTCFFTSISLPLLLVGTKTQLKK